LGENGAINAWNAATMDDMMMLLLLFLIAMECF
jgi:hypothetical protein